MSDEIKLKKERIIEAAINEFAVKGYENASTNEICKRAKVSKGLLFHYFGNKKKLYLQTIDVCIAYYMSRFDREINVKTNDILEIIYQINKVKLKLSLEKPVMQRLLSIAFVSPPGELKDEINKRYEVLYGRYMELIRESDKSRFRNDIDPQKAIEVVMMVMDSLSEKYIKIYREMVKEKGIDFAHFLNELQSYLDILKYGIYNKEED